MDEEMEPTVNEVLEQDTLKWIFVGGKGGVGKTTTSCSLAVLLAQKRESVLLISTDPAHNLSDAFNQKIGKEPTKIEGFENLCAMEVDAKSQSSEMMSQLGKMGNIAGIDAAGLFEDIGFSLPGIDEAMAFAEVLKLCKSLQFSVVVFDTAPTGHTIRLLSFPTVLDKALSKFMQLKDKFSGLMGPLSSMLGEQVTEEQLQGKWTEARDMISEVNAQFKNPDLTTFVCVCIPEFLSVYETERLVQELGNFEIDTHTIVANQVLFPEVGRPCGLCNARQAMQQKYLSQLDILYSDFHIVKMPLMKEEIRGLDKLREFAPMLTKPFVGPADAAEAAAKQ